MKQYINIDKVSWIKFIPEAETEWVFYHEPLPAKKFLGITYYSETPAGWFNSEYAHNTFNDSDRWGIPEHYLTTAELLKFRTDSKVVPNGGMGLVRTKANIIISLEDGSNFKEYFETDGDAIKAISAIQAQSIAKIRLIGVY